MVQLKQQSHIVGVACSEQVHIIAHSCPAVFCHLWHVKSPTCSLWYLTTNTTYSDNTHNTIRHKKLTLPYTVERSRVTLLALPNNSVIAMSTAALSST